MYSPEQLDEISADTALAASKEAGKRSGILAGLSGGDPKVKAKAVKKREQAERLYTASAKRRLKAKITPVKITREEYDFILSHLIDEGYTNTLEGAEVIASNMSDDWTLSILEATAMAKRGLNEPEIRQRIASQTGGGAAADRATALANRPTYGQRGVNPQARQRLAATQRGDFRKTTSSSPGLHGYGHKPQNAQQQALQVARGAQRGVLTPAEKKQLGR